MAERLAMPFIGMDLALDRMDVGDGGEVEIFAPDEGRQIGEEAAPELDVAGDWAAP
jgi:hypothetical protein